MVRYFVRVVGGRLKILNRKLHSSIRLALEDLKDAIGNTSGTRVTFGIPRIAE
jgi:hypothetical protein